MILRSGIGIAAPKSLIEFSRNFPDPGTAWQSNAIIGPALAFLLGATSGISWEVLHLAATIVALVMTAVLLFASSGGGERGRLVTIIAMVSSLPAVLFQTIGWYDVYSVSGWALLALARFRFSAIAGGAILACTNFEQSVVGLIGLTLVVLGFNPPDSSEHRSGQLRRIGAAAVALLASRFAIYLWFSHYPDSAFFGRSGMYDELLGDSVINFLRNGLTGVYSWFGLAWLPVVIGLTQIRKHVSRICFITIVTGVILVPGLFTATTFDGTRVFVLTSLGSFLYLLPQCIRFVQDEQMHLVRKLTLAWFSIVLLAPSITTVFSAKIASPWTIVDKVLDRL